MGNLFFCIPYRDVCRYPASSCSRSSEESVPGRSKLFCVTRYRHAKSGDETNARAIQTRKSPLPHTNPFYPSPCPETASACSGTDDFPVPLPFSFGNHLFSYVFVRILTRFAGRNGILSKDVIL